MAKSPHAGKIAIFLAVIIVGAAAVLGYSTLASKLDENHENKQKLQAQAAPSQAPTIDLELLKAKPTDIITGDSNAPVEIVEYASLSCPHCAHLSQEVLPEIEKQYVSTGKAKIIFRHFPLNEPAIKAAEVVECAQTNNLNRENFLKVLFSMQQQWAYGEKFVDDLRKIALVGGIDSAAFDSCLGDKSLETKILATRQEAETKLGVNSTPTLFINGKKFEGEMTASGIGKAIDSALEPTK